MTHSVSPRHNWPGAFVAYCHGCPLDEIAQVYGMELAVLDARIRAENWQKLRASLPLVAREAPGRVEKPTDGAAKLALIQQNRLDNLAGWVKLRDHALDMIERLRTGTLKMEKIFCNKYGVQRAETNLTTGDFVNLATYLQTISQGTYRALGDFEAQDKVRQDVLVSAQSPAPAITIILPGVISAPREQRAIEAESQVIDLRPEVITPTAKKEVPKSKTVEDKPNVPNGQPHPSTDNRPI